MSGRGALGKTALPTPVRKAVRGFTSALRRPTASKRVFPNFLIVGAQRSGTTSLFYYLERHPNVFGPLRNKGVHYYDTGYHHGPDWFRTHFPTRRAMAEVEATTGHPTAVGEGSPYYLFHPLIPARVAGTLPDTRIIALLRDPVDRAVSHHQHEVARGFEDLSLADALAAEPRRLAGEVERLRADPTYVSHAHMHHAYAARSRYGEQLDRWLDVFPAEQLLVLSTDAMKREPAATVDRAIEFLGLPPIGAADYPIYNERTYDPGDTELRAELAASFAASNARVRELTGIEFGTAAEQRMTA